LNKPNQLDLANNPILAKAIGGNTAQILRTVAVSKILDHKLPQMRDGSVNAS